MLKLCCAAALALMAAACVTADPHGFSAQEVQSWKVVSVEGVIPDNVRVLWPKAEEEYLDKALPVASAKLVTDPNSGHERQIAGERPPMTEEVRRGAWAHVRSRFSERVRHVMDPLRGALAGQRPVKLVTTLHGLDVPSRGRQFAEGLAMRLVLGPGAPMPSSRMAVSTDVVDARTGAVLASYPRRTMTLPGGEALISFNSADPYGTDAVVAMLRDYETGFATWLLKTGG
jgi:hypothetical protein